MRANLDALVPAGAFKGQPRPTLQHPAVKALVLEDLLPEILAWADDIDEDNIRRELAEVLNPSLDGYGLAKNLERRYSWCCDAALVGILEDADFFGACRLLLQRWVEENSLTPHLAVGDQVRVRVEGDIRDGEIRRIDQQHGQYVVCVPSLGHVREGVGTHGVCLDWEFVEGRNLAVVEA